MTVNETEVEAYVAGEPVTEVEARSAAKELLRWADERDDELARLHARAHHYLEHEEWITKEEARS
jgi:hypothetical protein